MKTTLEYFVLIAVLSSLLGFTARAQVPPVLCEELEQHGQLERLPDNVGVLLMTYKLETPTEASTGKLLLNPGRLPIGPPTLPTDVLTKHGFYIGVTPETSPDRYAYLVRLADPSFVVGESPGRGDRVESRVLRRSGSVLATRIPFLPGGKLIVCEVTPNERRVRVVHPLGNAPFPPSGQVFKGSP